MKKRTIIIIAIAAVILLLIILKKAGVFGGNNDALQVEVAQVELSTLTQKVSATGKIQPELEVKLSSEVSGEIIELPVKEGQQVKKGDLLVRINPDIYQSGVKRSIASLQTTRASQQQTEATLKEAEESYKRSKTLYDKGVISKSDWDKVVATYEGAKANRESARFNVQSAMATVSEAQDNLKKTVIYAPTNGTISKLSVELGERVVGTIQMSGTEIMRLANLRSMEVEVDVNENDIVKVKIGDSVNIEVDAYLKRVFKGRVTNIANTANSTTSVDQVTNFKVKIHIEEDSYKDLLVGKPEGYSPFRPGMTATVDILTNTKKDVVAVPISAIIIKKRSEIDPKTPKAEADKRTEAVYVLKNGKAELRAVDTGIQDNVNIEIISGVSKGETIITGPYSTITKLLKNNDPVQTGNK
ncbi:HlyD family secretion protein [Capnocytophaga haemolytica]|uniref:Efflux transporter periplasmic adaptor subunit n=1 Tax=Capnocytophaga haemolytica TaxID=45243 RepID=A0AAX2H238_9FLAO|nr:efflux RND transporter periplasmic adaptor subunit [Capnocytophaga haemolytica]AMD85614.1 efflux transporter periplasmic adaptor subunit [Capnocytophaga haemolytica]SFN88840.1 HlyD family secretion protein [Capnocytophaga haemolytica]SNV16775.1 Macrolide-specific efflux protein macA precursor [Capnocytophaga haemolytica]